MPVERSKLGGGPMFHADEIGLAAALATIRGYTAGGSGGAWEPAPPLVTRAGQRATFGALDR